MSPSRARAFDSPPTVESDVVGAGGGSAGRPWQPPPRAASGDVQDPVRGLFPSPPSPPGAARPARAACPGSGTGGRGGGGGSRVDSAWAPRVIAGPGRDAGVRGQRLGLQPGGEAGAWARVACAVCAPVCARLWAAEAALRTDARARVPGCAQQLGTTGPCFPLASRRDWIARRPGLVLARAPPCAERSPLQRPAPRPGDNTRRPCHALRRDGVGGRRGSPLRGHGRRAPLRAGPAAGGPRCVTCPSLSRWA